MRIGDVPYSGVYLQVGSIVQLVVQLIDLSTITPDNPTGDPIQLQTAENLIISILYPDLSSKLTVPAKLYTDGADGRIVYTTVNNGTTAVDLSEVGLYKIQGRATIGGIVLPPSLETDFYCLPNVEGSDMPPTAYTVSAVAFISGSGDRWVMTVDTTGDLLLNPVAFGPNNALTVHTFVLKDDNGIYWTYTVDDNGILTPAQGGNYQQSIDILAMVDTAGMTWVVTPSSVDGTLGAE